CQLLLALDAPDAVAKTMKLLAAAPTQEEQLVYVHHLRTIKTGWTPELRREYLSWWIKDRSAIQHAAYVLKWFDDAGIRYTDGSSFPNFIAHFHDDTRQSLSPSEQTTFAEILAAYIPPNAKGKKPPKARAVVK